MEKYKIGYWGVIEQKSDEFLLFSNEFLMIIVRVLKIFSF